MPLNVPSLIHDGAKFADMTPFAYVIGFSEPFVANCWIRPGWAMSAMSGGRPPATEVARIVGRLSPRDL